MWGISWKRLERAFVPFFGYPRYIKDIMKTFVIAEVGSTHGGKWTAIEDSIQIARDAGADCFKLQWTSSPERMCERRKAPEYKEAYRLINTPTHWFDGIAREVERRGLKFICSVYLPEDVAIVSPYVYAFKVSSFEAEAEDLIEAFDPYADGKTIYVSLGGMTQLDFDFWGSPPQIQMPFEDLQGLGAKPFLLP